jgi:hypothetical protein
MTPTYRWTFLVLGSILGLLFIATGIMLAFVMDGWHRFGCAPPVLLGYVLIRYFFQKYRPGDQCPAEHTK